MRIAAILDALIEPATVSSCVRATLVQVARRPRQGCAAHRHRGTSTAEASRFGNQGQPCFTPTDLETGEFGDRSRLWPKLKGILLKQDKAAFARASHAAARSRSCISSSASVSLLTIACLPNVTPSSARSRLIFSATAYGLVMSAG